MKRSTLLISLLAYIFIFSSCDKSDTKKISGNIIDRDTLGFKYIDLVHCTHTDYGYTDHVEIALDLHKRYLDIALDLALSTQNNPEHERFKWTAEALDPFWKWWNDADDNRKKLMKKMIDNGQIAVNAMPFHIHPFIDGNQWEKMLDWIPETEREAFDIKIGMQHDVNVFPRSAAMNLSKKGINHIWTGINSHWGGSPFKLPTAFWWNMPDNSKLLVWAGFPYWEGYAFFAEREWRAGQRDASNTQFSWPRKGDILNTDSMSILAAHKVCINRLSVLRESGYNYPILPLSFTNQWRMDNDGPIAELPEFVKKWNEMGLKPELRISTVNQAMKNVENEIGQSIESYSGEWQDWWSFGLAATPRELQASRRATAYIRAVSSPLFGKLSSDMKININNTERDLCRYYEHTFASNETSNTPYSLFNLGQLYDKYTYAYRPLEQSKWMFAQQLRSLLYDEKDGVYIVNTGNSNFSGWVNIDNAAFRGVDYKSIYLDNQVLPLEEGNRFWVDNIEPQSLRRYKLSTDDVIEKKITNENQLKLSFDKNGWVESVRWNSMSEPMLISGIADLMVLNVNENNRWSLGDWYCHLDTDLRTQKINEITEQTWAQPNTVSNIKDGEHSIEISQELKHHRFNNINRKIEIYKNEPRVKIKLSYDRISSTTPEVIYLKFPFPDSAKNIETTNGGIPYKPYSEHIPNSCKDFFVVDNWVKFSSDNKTNWVWSSPDVPIVNFGGHNFCTRINDAPINSNELYAMVYNNIWVVNFLVDCPGVINYEFDIYQNNEEHNINDINNIVETYINPLGVVINPVSEENSIINRYMNNPRCVNPIK